MANELPDTSKIPPAPAATAASWERIFAGILISVLLLGGAGFLFLQFLQQRPINLKPHSEALMQQVQRSLDELYIPVEGISVGVPEEVSRERASWLRYPLEINLPPHIDVDGFRELFTQNLLEYDIAVRESTTGSPNDLVLTFSDYDFVQMRVDGVQRVAAPERSDYTESTERLAEEVRQAVAETGILPEAIAFAESEAREDEAATWSHTQIQVRVQDMATAQGIYASVSERMQARPDVVTTAESTEDATLVRISYLERPAVEVSVEAAEAGAPMLDAPLPAAEEDPASAPAPEGMIEAHPRPRLQTSDVIAPTPPPLEELPLEKLPEGEAGSPKKQASALPPEPTPPGTPPRVAIIIDDGGYGGPPTEAILGMTPKLTLAILPNATYTADTVTRARNLGFELMLHMPMQATKKNGHPFPGQIEVGMGVEEIQALAQDAISQVPGLIGVNNHTGSLYTTYADKMAEFLEVVQKQGLYFIDSLTDRNSQAYTVAKEMGIIAGRRDVFIDHDMNEKMIRQRFDEMIALAKKRGSAIGIAHFRPLTTSLLPELLKKLETEGIELVHVSELLS